MHLRVHLNRAVLSRHSSDPGDFFQLRPMSLAKIVIILIRTIAQKMLGL